MQNDHELVATDLGLCAFLMAKGFNVLAIRDSRRGTKKAFVFEAQARQHVKDYYDGALAPARTIVENTRRLKAQLFHVETTGEGNGQSAGTT